MSSKNDNYQDVEQGGKLLSAQERVAFKMIAKGNDLHGQRALALLAIDEGSTQEQAGQRAGLTTGQVKYWLGKFRRVRMDIFPEQVLNADETAPDQGASGQGAQVADKTKKTKKSKNKKSNKKSKKSKKKGKKSKKKGKKKSEAKQGKKSKNKKSNKKKTK